MLSFRVSANISQVYVSDLFLTIRFPSEMKCCQDSYGSSQLEHLTCFFSEMKCKLRLYKWMRKKRFRVGAKISQVYVSDLFLTIRFPSEMKCCQDSYGSSQLEHLTCFFSEMKCKLRLYKWMQKNIKNLSI